MDLINFINSMPKYASWYLWLQYAQNNTSNKSTSINTLMNNLAHLKHLDQDDQSRRNPHFTRPEILAIITNYNKKQPTSPLHLVILQKVINNECSHLLYFISYSTFQNKLKTIFSLPNKTTRIKIKYIKYYLHILHLTSSHNSYPNTHHIITSHIISFRSIYNLTVTN